MALLNLVRKCGVPAACLGLVLLGWQTGRPQTPPVPSTPPTGTPPAPPGAVPRVDLIPPPATPAPPADLLPVPVVPAAPAKPSIEDLIARIEKIRAQKAELDRQEKTAAEELREALGKQQEALNKLGLGGPAWLQVPAPKPAR